VFHLRRLYWLKEARQFRGSLEDGTPSNSNMADLEKVDRELESLRMRLPDDRRFPHADFSAQVSAIMQEMHTVIERLKQKVRGAQASGGASTAVLTKMVECVPQCAKVSGNGGRGMGSREGRGKEGHARSPRLPRWYSLARLLPLPVAAPLRC